MTKWIAFPAAALLCAALARPRPEPPSARRPAAMVVEALPSAAADPLPFLEIFADPQLPSTSAVRPIQESPHRHAVWAEVARLLEQAYTAVYDKRYLRAVGACEEVLRIDPHYGVAGELLTLALRQQHMTIADEDSIHRAIEPWVVCTNDDPGRPSIPYPETFRLPSFEEWASIVLSKLFGTNDSARLDDGDSTIEGIHRKLETMKVDLAFENTKLEDILAFIRDFSGLNLVLDAAVRDRVDPDQAITFKVKDLVLKNILKLLLAQFQLDYFVTEERVILLTDFRGPPMQDGGRDLLTLLGSPGSERPLLPQNPADLLEMIFVRIDARNAPLSAIVEELREKTGLDIRLRHEVEGAVSLQVEMVTAQEVLRLLLPPRNLMIETEGQTIFIRSRH